MILLLVRIACGQSSAQPGFITVVANTVGGNGTFGFVVVNAVGGNGAFGFENNFTLETKSGTATQTFSVAPGPGYNVKETTLPERWAVPPSAVCTNGKPDAFAVAAGENTTCTFTSLLPSLTRKLPDPMLCDKKHSIDDVDFIDNSESKEACTLTRFDRINNWIKDEKLPVDHTYKYPSRVWAINGSKVIYSGTIISAPAGTDCSDNDWRVALLSEESSSVLIYGPADISEYCDSARGHPETPRVMLVVPVLVIWAQVFHYPGNLGDPLRKVPGKAAAPAKYCGATIETNDPRPTDDPNADKRPGGIKPCDAESGPMQHFYHNFWGRSWGAIYNPLTQPGTSQGTISFSPAIGSKPTGNLLCLSAGRPPGCLSTLKAPAQSMSFDVQLYPSAKKGPGWIGLPVYFEKASATTANFDSLSIAVSYDWRPLDHGKSRYLAWPNRVAWHDVNGSPRDLPRLSIRPPEFMIKCGPEFATAKPHDINLVAGATVRVPILLDIHSYPSAISIFPVVGIEGGDHIHSHLTQTDDILRKVVGYDASLRVPFILTHAFLGDKPAMVDFSWRTRYLSYPEPFTDYVSGIQETLTKQQRSYWRGDFIVPISTLVQFKVTVLHGGLPPDYAYLGYNVNIGFTFANPGYSEH
jgi:hypothetical protein